MNITTIYEMLIVIIILSRLVMLRNAHRQKSIKVRFCYWLAIVAYCSILIRLTDGRIIASSLQIAGLALIALALWADQFFRSE